MNYSSLQARSTASVSSDASTVRASNRDTTLPIESSSKMANPSKLSDSQKATFYAVWDTMSDWAKNGLARFLHMLMGVQSHVGNGGDQGAVIGEMFLELAFTLRYHASEEDVSQFMIDLKILSSDAVLEMIAMTEPVPTGFVTQQEGNRDDEEESTIATSSASTIVACTAASVASNAATVASNASTIANAARTISSNASTISSAAASTATTATGTASTVANSVVTTASTLSSAASAATTVASTTTSESTASL